MKVQIAKGVKDSPPEESLAKARVVDVLKKNFELYGFNPLETPTIERFEVLASKYAGGAEILKETFKLNDQGERELCLRYDLTVPFARYIAMNPQLKLPFKRYQIGQVFRDGPIKLGRLREFTQCDVDVVGTKDVFVDAELLKIASNSFSELGINIEIQYNDRKLLDAILETSGVPEQKRIDAILALDKIKKVGEKEVRKEMAEKGITEKMADSLFELIEKPLDKMKLKNESAKENLTVLAKNLKLLKVKATLTPSLARGLAYYTGTVFEIFAKDSKITSSISAGGRYDNMITDFVGNNQEYPAVGISFGLDVISEVIKEKQATAKKTTVKVLIVPIGVQDTAIEILQELRTSGIPSDLSQKKGVSKSLDYAASYNIPYAIFVGEDEIKTGKYTLRNMDTGKEESLEITEICKKLK